jgi:hypothetical protein
MIAADLPSLRHLRMFEAVARLKEKRDSIVRTLAAYARLYRFLSSPQSKDEFVAAARRLGTA